MGLLVLKIDQNANFYEHELYINLEDCIKTKCLTFLEFHNNPKEDKFS